MKKITDYAENPKQYIKDHGYRMEKSVLSDYWRLLKGDDLVCDDSACEDVYDEETAAYIFALGIAENEF